MDPARRTLLQVGVTHERKDETNVLVESLMGRKPELRYQFIQSHARSVAEGDVDV